MRLRIGGVIVTIHVPFVDCYIGSIGPDRRVIGKCSFACSIDGINVPNKRTPVAGNGWIGIGRSIEDRRPLHVAQSRR